jgi:MFS family permease
MGANIGTALAPPFLTALMLLFGWRAMFIIMGAIGIASAFLWFILYREPNKSVLEQEDLDYLAGTPSVLFVRPGGELALREDLSGAAEAGAGG